MDIKIAKTKVDEADLLLSIQKQAFQADLEKYKDYATSPAFETLNSFIQRIIFGQHYTIFINEEIAGSIDIRRISNHHYILNQICLNPNIQNHGYGSKIMKIIEEMFPNVKRWSLKTQMDNKRNRHFYEKAGYTAVGDERINHRLSLVEYEKKIDDLHFKPSFDDKKNI